MYMQFPLYRSPLCRWYFLCLKVFCYCIYIVRGMTLSRAASVVRSELQQLYTVHVYISTTMFVSIDSGKLCMYGSTTNPPFAPTHPRAHTHTHSRWPLQLKCAGASHCEGGCQCSHWHAEGGSGPVQSWGANQEERAWGKVGTGIQFQLLQVKDQLS